MFKFLKNKSNKKNEIQNIEIYAPLSGTSMAIEDVDDVVFAQKAVGDGMAVVPASNLLVAPCDGVVKMIHDGKHALVIEANDKFEVLIHVGIDTVNLKGEGFKVLTEVGKSVAKGESLIELNLEYLQQHAKSTQTMVIISNLDEHYAVEKEPIQAVTSGQSKLFSIISKKKKESSVESNHNEGLNTKENSVESIEKVTVLNPVGLHARPVSVIINIVKKSKSEVYIIKDGKKAKAKSLIEILGLSVKYLDEIEIMATGDDSKSVAKELVEAFKSGLGESVDPEPANKSKRDNDGNTGEDEDSLISDVFEGGESEVYPDINNKDKRTVVSGISVFPGIVIGNAFLIEKKDIKIEENSKLNPHQEKSRLNQAIDLVKIKINTTIEEAKNQHLDIQAEIFTALVSVLDDEFLTDAAVKEIELGKSAEYAWRFATKKTAEVLSNTNNHLLKERTSDIYDMERSVLKALLGYQDEAINLSSDTIIVAQDLAPSDIAKFSHNVKGIILAKGSTTSHVAIMLKNRGYPTIVSAGIGMLKVKNGTSVILESRLNKATFNPEAEGVEIAKVKIQDLDKKKQKNLSNAKDPAVTVDGKSITVLGNVGNLSQAKAAFTKGAEGIGLVRSEFLFYNEFKAPSEDQQLKAYQDICDAMQGNSIIVRTLDVGGDKPLTYIKLPHEDNPIVGLRGVRTYVYYEKIFINQIRALLRVTPVGICKIMIPMVSLVSEVIYIKKIIAEQAKLLGVDLSKIKIGVMIEVPSAAVMSEALAKHLDFFSIGTNDLAQYTLAMDRGHSILTKKIENLNPAILKMIDFTIQGANISNIPVGVCGAMASEIESVPLLVGLGVMDLSVSRDLIPDVKSLIRSLDSKKCYEAAQKALNMNSSDEVKTLIEKEFSYLI